MQTTLITLDAYGRKTYTRPLVAVQALLPMDGTEPWGELQRRMRVRVVSEPYQPFGLIPAVYLGWAVTGDEVLGYLRRGFEVQVAPSSIFELERAKIPYLSCSGRGNDM